MQRIEKCDIFYCFFFTLSVPTRNVCVCVCESVSLCVCVRLCVCVWSDQQYHVDYPAAKWAVTGAYIALATVI